ncbi:hypothetical protein [Cupriavidus sp. RAF12]|uniref:hypothetical protein n=1 Tax=Cupriavidus sp. RAF12 TaxID=3233050 RepID=UPI003F9009A7
MSEKLRWIIEPYCGMYIHAIAFEIAELGRTEPPPGQKWGYAVAIRYTAEHDDDLDYGPASDRSDYFTREAAEQAAIHYGQLAIDVLLDLG